jgi:hypothetical protein
LLILIAVKTQVISNNKIIVSHLITRYFIAKLFVCLIRVVIYLWYNSLELISILFMNRGGTMHCWFLLAGNDPEKLRAKFINFFYNLNFPRGMALWKWKKTCWICSPENHKNDILTSFIKYGIVEFSSAPSPSDIEFIYGDDQSLNSLS